MRKLAIISILLLGLSSITYSQKPKVKNDPNHDDKPLHFGFSLGVNYMDYRLQHSEAAKNDGVFIGLEQVKYGIDIHAISNLRLAKNLDFRLMPGISFSDRYLYYDGIMDDGDTLRVENKVPSAYIEMPMSFKYKSKRLNNFRPYLLGGANIRYNLAVKKVYEEQLIVTDPLNWFGEFGVGMDFYMTYFKLGVEIKYSHGLRNILARTDKNGNPPNPEYAKYTDYIDKISSHIVIVSLHFE